MCGVGPIEWAVGTFAADLVLPTVRMRSRAHGRNRAKGERAGCKADILAVVTAAGRALTRKEVVRALKAAGKQHGPGPAAKALADLTGADELVNSKDKKGYRPAGWRRSATPSMFD